MSHLKALEAYLGSSVRASAKVCSSERVKMFAALAEQKQMAEAKIAGRYFRAHAHGSPQEQLRAFVSRSRGAFPESGLVELVLDATGKVFFGIRYAGKPIQLRTRTRSG